MKVVDVCAFYSPHGGGVKTYVEQKLRIAPQLGHDVTIVAPGDVSSTIHVSDNARIVTLPSPRFPLDRKYWYFDDEIALHATLDALSPDFVEVSSPWRSPSLVARWNSRTPRALVMHAEPLSAYAYRWLGPVMPLPAIDRTFERYWDHLRRLSHSFDTVICASEDLRSRLTEGGVPNGVTIPMGIDENLFSPDRRDLALRRKLLRHCGLKEDAYLLIGAGRLSAEKRWPLVIDAVLAASNDLPLGLVLFGEGKERHRLERQIGANPHIQLMGIVRDRTVFASIMASADALIHGCEAETFCMTAAEATASGIPIIVPDRGGAADHAREGRGRCYRAASALAASCAISETVRSPGHGTPSHAVTMREHFVALFAHYQHLAGVTRAAA